MINDSFIVGKNNQGVDFRGTILRLNRYSIAFEVYNPYSILQLSEVLLETKIYVRDEVMYSGRMVVSSLVNTGIILVCEATLEEAWRDIDTFSFLLEDTHKLKSDFVDFSSEWRKNISVHNNFKVIISDIQIFLMDLKNWMEQVEIGIRFDQMKDRLSVERKVINDLQDSILSISEPLFEKFEHSVGDIGKKEQALYGAYVRRQLHHLLLCSPFVHRTFTKPLGYAGDYEMVNMILRDPLEGSSLFAKLVNYRFLQQAPAAAHRNRIEYLVIKLREETFRCMNEGRQTKIFNLGCGPAKEVQKFLHQDDLCDRTGFVLVDFNEETLNYAQSELYDIRSKNRRITPIKSLQRSVQQILKESHRESNGVFQEKYDFVYCAGLFDYLSDRFCHKLMNIFYSMLAPGGLLVITNVANANPIKGLMQYILEWHLVYRDEKQLMSLRPEKSLLENVNIKYDSTGVNLFLEVRRPQNDEGGGNNILKCSESLQAVR